MGVREDPSAEAATVNLPGRHGDGTHEDHNDEASTERVSRRGFQKTNDGQPIGHNLKDSFGPHLDEYRTRIDHRLRKARVWHAMVDEAFNRYYQKWIIEGLLRQKPLPPSKDGRHVPLTAGDVRISPLIDERSGKHYESNSIRSSRYTILSFVPKQLFFQFSRLANFYFLVIGLLQQGKGWSTTGRYTTIGPLIAFVVLTMAKEGYDDYRRYLLDKEDNLALVSVLTPNGILDEGSSPKSRGLFVRKLGEKQIHENVETTPTESRLEVKHEESRGHWAQVKWWDIRVGDIIRLKRNERVPADIALLHATGANSIAYIDTMALDGETSLKSKQPSTLVANRCDTISKLEKFSAELVCEDPNANLYDFEGRITVDGEMMPLTINEVVFRGSTIRNTSETIGVVINTGEECKIRMNANQHVHTKSPKISRFTNRIVLSLVFILIAITAGISGGYVLWQRQYEKKNPFLALAPVDGAPLIFGTIILLNALIPLSLYIIIEFVKVVQAYQLNDIEMYDAETDTPISINTNTILEDLGQVNYIFSDKTGTLTENNMQFRKLSVGGTSWLHSMNVARDDVEGNMHQNAEKITHMDLKAANGSDVETTPPATASVGTSTSQPGSGTEAMLDYIQRFPNTVFSKKARHFLLCIALCHTCLPEVSEDGSITFQAASPDEVALVQAAQDMGFLMIDRPAQSIKLRVMGQYGEFVMETYDVLKVIEFSSNRKRMSIVLRMPDGRICVICKGADNVIMSRLRLSGLATKTAAEVDRRAHERHSLEAERALHRRSLATPRSSHHGRRSSYFRRSYSYNARNSRDLRSLGRRSGEEDDETRTLRSEPMALPGDISDDNRDGVINESIAADEAKVFEICFRHIDEYATEGLRTLLYGYRYITDEEYDAWNASFKAATTSLVNRQERIEEAGESLERDFELAGASAIEDKLQAGVPETIDKLRRANIKVWMLTGDKRETAINIARSASLAKSFSQIYVLDVTAANLQETMRSIFVDIDQGLVSHSVLVIDGLTLDVVENDKILNSMFFELAVLIDSVICCRASPNQKATLVKGIRDTNQSCVTLAIGDGANDIAMIQASHVGIGISGREGLQAARVADYSIAQFRFLQRLLLVHGHWLYLRTSKYMLCTFWKEWVFYIAQAQYQRFNGYSGTSLYQSWSLTTYNAVFTSLPVFFLGFCEQDLSPETLLAVPELYSFGQRDEGINLKKCIAWLLTGTVDTIVIFVVIWAEFQYNLTAFPNGVHDSPHDNSLFPMGALAMTIIIAHINVKILVLEMHNKSWLPLGACALSISLWFFFNLILGALPAKYSKDAPYRIVHAFTQTFGNTLSWWVIAIVGISIVVGLNLGVTAIQRVFFPTDRNLWQEIEKHGDVNRVAREHNREEGGRMEGEGKGRQEDGPGGGEAAARNSRDV
ncbi:phospholipid-translocating P-type ATPase [Xylariaceae sp. AK1471]|nr:phospholipid-translocating P-type ATPase [Xylariaceae sp. AK1471]